MDLGLKGRVALVTGSSQGIGRAVAELFGREGARVVVTYKSGRERAEQVGATIRASGGEALVRPFDLGSLDSVTACRDAALEAWGRIDILVNNAISWGELAPVDIPAFEALPPAEWLERLRANIGGAYAAAQAVVPSMRSRGWGRIVNMSSTLALASVPGASWYSTVKAALLGLTRNLSVELGPAGILANAVLPGLTTTERSLATIPAALREQAAAASPIRRLLGPEEIAPAVVFLCSPVNTGVTGEILRVSGGGM
jgi:3-oxoacyl-[acyl-carrier protein] reductase